MCLLILFPVTFSSTLLGYVVFSIYICVGLAMVIKTEDVGSAIYEINYRITSIVWKNLLHMNEAEITKRRIKLEDTPAGFKFTIGITFFVGLGLIAISIWAIFMLAEGKMF